MINIDASFVDAEAPNANAIKNGRGLVAKGKFVALHKSADGTLLFGECRGSGKSNYRTSCDFIRPGAVTYRCSCPSRQFPCKHCIGLMYAFVDGNTFTEAAVPDDIVSKREKFAKKAEKKATQASKPRKGDKSALKKKIRAQLEGLDLLEGLTRELIRTGMGNTNDGTLREVTQHAKRLGDAYLPGAQAALLRYVNLLGEWHQGSGGESAEQQRDARYSECLDQLVRLDALVRHGRAYLHKRVDDPELLPETESPIAAWLGHAWQLRELRDAGLTQSQVELLQLAFWSFDDTARNEFVDMGIWMNLANGKLHTTKTYRPYKAANYIKEDDAFSQVAVVPELCVYPGGLNPRVRWDGMTPRTRTPEDLEAVQTHAHSSFDGAFKVVKKDMKTPLSEKGPVLALQFRRIGRVGEELVIEDAEGNRLTLTDSGDPGEPATCPVIDLVSSEALSDQTLIVRFHHDLDARTLRAKPLGIVTQTHVLRLTF